MRALKLVVPSAILMTGFVICTTASYGKPEYSKKEGKNCVTCHAKVEAKEGMTKNLNETGKCYAENEHSLAKCKVPEKK
jgi:hypothetical protein